jgi:hypothetical protein
MARKIHAPLRQFDAFAIGEPEIFGIHTESIGSFALAEGRRTK